MNNISRTFAGAAALLSLAVFCPNPANAEPTEQLISQLRGHETYQGAGDIAASDIYIGRVRGISGDVISIELIDPIVVEGKEYRTINTKATGTVARRVLAKSDYNNNSIGYPIPGDDVGVAYQDGQWVIVGRYQPYWVTRLDLKEVPVVERSAFEWDPKPFGLPPLQQRTVVIEREPAAAPVRGMW
ncbi:conserved hypothetical protein [Gloeothece citriformis PCC 7424]|uniref:PRC-barrel domain-containing protein n=1 Tax=Gloeothece citriformis (strain PCC 7424) TaxID=65393 RepID=B7KC51_GLOC7|nr:hypothetical protein [Gloeothece citriformis]ACK68874.1 conserved hypothetical protein [Gloeothece citriformis PCC 7424]